MQSYVLHLSTGAPSWLDEIYSVTIITIILTDDYLICNKRVIYSLLSHQFVMRPLLLNRSSVHSDNHISRLHGGQSMCNDDGGPALTSLKV